jgi:hypothetical protein
MTGCMVCIKDLHFPTARHPKSWQWRCINLNANLQQKTIEIIEALKHIF